MCLIISAPLRIGFGRLPVNSYPIPTRTKSIRTQVNGRSKSTQALQKVYSHLGDKPFGRQMFEQQDVWETDIWVTRRLDDRHLGDILGDTIFILSVLLSPLAIGDDRSLQKLGVDWCRMVESLQLTFTKANNKEVRLNITVV